MSVIGDINRMDRRNNLAALVKELKRDLSQEDFAKKLDLSKGAVQKWEAKISDPDRENMKKLAKLAGWTFEELDNFLSTGVRPDRVEKTERYKQAVLALDKGSKYEIFRALSDDLILAAEPTGRYSA